MESDKFQEQDENNVSAVRNMLTGMIRDRESVENAYSRLHE